VDNDLEWFGLFLVVVVGIVVAAGVVVAATATSIALSLFILKLCGPTVFSEPPAAWCRVRGQVDILAPRSVTAAAAAAAAHVASPTVSVGLCKEAFATEGKQPGWDRHSWAFHGDDGR
jgi:hypothetical protein